MTDGLMDLGVSHDSINTKINNFFQSFDSVTIMFCELVGFNSATVKDAMDVVCSMNAVFSCFDSLMDKFNVYKVSIHEVRSFEAPS